jgi:hypothetical protein
VNPMFIGLILVTLASMAIVAMTYAAKSRRQLAPANRPERRIAHSDEGSVVLPVRNAQSASTGKAAKKLALTPAARQEQAVALDHQVDDTIRRLILMN